MGLARTWIRRVAGAAGASLALPVGVLAAAGAIALSGGLGGLGGLGQVAAGPSLPDTGTAGAHRRATRDVDVAAVLPPPAPAPAPSSAVGSPAGAGTPAAGAPSPSGGTSPGTGAPQTGPQAPTPGNPAAGAPSGGGSPAGSGGGGGSAPTPQQGPAQQVIDTTRGLGDSLPPPVAPVTGEVLDLVLGPPPGR